MGQRVRLAVLLTCLGLAVLGLAKSRGNVFSGENGPPAAASSACSVSELPGVASVHLDQLLALRASLLSIVASVGGMREPGGVITPERIWLESPPQALRLSRSPGGYWPGGYEMRQRTNDGEEVVADVFLFSHPFQVRKYFDQATNIKCHQATTQSPTFRPRLARNLVSLALSDFTSYRVLMSRGQRVYRVVILRPRRVGMQPSRAERNAGSSKVDDLACKLAVAGCAGQAQ